MNNSRTKVYLLIVISFTFFIFLAYKNNQPKNEVKKHSEIQPVEKNWVSSKPKKQCEFDPEKFLESLVYVQGNYGAVGSGFIIELDNQKYVVTANHVVSFHDQDKFNLNFYHREPNQYPVTILGKDTALDIALLKFDPKEDTSDMPTLDLGDSDELKRLDPLISMGDPWPTQFIIDTGKVIIPQTNLINQVNGGNHPACIIHDCPTAQGSSGGPIINKCGEVVGVNQRFLPNRPFFIHYSACESNAIKVILNDLKKGGEIKHWDPQIFAEMKNRLNAHHLKVDNLSEAPKESGLVIFGINPNSACREAGLVIGDIIIEVDSHPMKSAKEFYYYVYVTPRDENFEPTFKIKRAGKEMKIKVKKIEKITPVPDPLDILKDILDPNKQN